MTKHYITDEALHGIEEGLPLVDIPVYIAIERLPNGVVGVTLGTDHQGIATLLDGLWTAGGRFRIMGQAIAEQLGIKYSK